MKGKPDIKGLTPEIILKFLEYGFYNIDMVLWDFNLQGFKYHEILEVLATCFKKGLIYVDHEGLLDVV